MDKKVKNILVAGAIVVTVYFAGKFILASVGTAITLGVVAAVGYLGYQKIKQLKAAKSFQQEVSVKKAPFQVSNENKSYRKPQTEADFLFSSGSNREDL